MSRAARIGLFLVGVGGLAAVLVWGMGGLPPLGAYRGPYGDVLNRVCVAERRATDVVTAVNFDYRGIDTVGEEFILFASVMAAVLLLRKLRDEREEACDDEAEDRAPPDTSDAVRGLTLGLVGPSIVYGFYIVTHGQLTPGGGFQGGVILASTPLLVYLGGDVARFARIAPEKLVEAAEGLGAFGFVAIGLGALFVGRPYLTNVLPLGTAKNALSAGTIPLISLTTGIEVAAGFVLLLATFLDEVLRRRRS